MLPRDPDPDGVHGPGGRVPDPQAPAAVCVRPPDQDPGPPWGSVLVLALGGALFFGWAGGGVLTADPTLTVIAALTGLGCLVLSRDR